MSLVSIRKKGYLYKLPVKGFVKKWNRRWFVLHATNIEGIVRLEYYDSETYEATAMGKRTIPLRQCKDLSPTGGTKTRPYVFQFMTPMGHHVFAADTHTDMEEWMSAMQEAIVEDRQRNRRKKAQSLIIQQAPEQPTQSLSTSGIAQVPVEAMSQSDPYEPSNSGTYRVTLELNETTKRLKFTGMIYNLDITPDSISLIAADSGADVAKWGYRQIRTYGKSSGKFNFECGRTAETGPGQFVFKTTCSKEIFGVVHRNIKRIRTQVDEERGASRQKGVRIPKQTSLPEHLQQAKSPTEAKDHRTHQPMKPMPYKTRKGEAKSMSLGTYRLSREFGNPPSYEEISAAKPIKETETPVNQPANGLPDGLYSTVDKSRKKKKTQDAVSQSGVANEQSTVRKPVESNSYPLAINDPFHQSPFLSSPDQLQQSRQHDNTDNPFQLDPFLFSPQPGANSFNLAPDTDPFTIPPPPTDTLDQAANPGTNVLDDLGQLDIATGGAAGFDAFNFDPPLIGASPSTDVASKLPPLTVNPISDSSGLNFDVDLLDDRLFDTLAQLDDSDDTAKKENLGAKEQASEDFGFSNPHSPSDQGATAAGSHQNKQKRLSQQDFDNLWKGICATMPATDS